MAGRDAPHPLNRPRPVKVRAGNGESGREGEPIEIAGVHVEAVRETWLLEDRWWTDRPLRRRYWEVVDARGRNVVVFHDLFTGRWFSQAA